MFLSTHSNVEVKLEDIFPHAMYHYPAYGVVQGFNRCTHAFVCLRPCVSIRDKGSHLALQYKQESRHTRKSLRTLRPMQFLPVNSTQFLPTFPKVYGRKQQGGTKPTNMTK